MTDRITPTPEVMAAHLDGEAILLNMTTKDYHQLSETGAFIWKRLERGTTVSSVVADLCEEFDVDSQMAERELVRLIGELEQRGLVQRQSVEEP